MPLVMVHAYDAVETAPPNGQIEGRIRWNRTDGFHSLTLCLLNGGLYFIGLFAAEKPAFAGMGIQAENRNARLIDKPLESIVG